MCNNLTIITSLNKNLLPENVPKIKYEQVEAYWHKKYGKSKPKKNQRPELTSSTDLGTVKDIKASGKSTIKSIEFNQITRLKETV